MVIKQEKEITLSKIRKREINSPVFTNDIRSTNIIYKCKGMAIQIIIIMSCVENTDLTKWYQNLRGKNASIDRKFQDGGGGKEREKPVATRLTIY